MGCECAELLFVDTPLPRHHLLYPHRLHPMHSCQLRGVPLERPLRRALCHDIGGDTWHQKCLRGNKWLFLIVLLVIILQRVVLSIFCRLDHHPLILNMLGEGVGAGAVRDALRLREGDRVMIGGCWADRCPAPPIPAAQILGFLPRFFGVR